MSRLRAAALLLCSALGCANLEHTELCAGNGSPVLPAGEIRFISAKGRVECHADTGEKNVAEWEVKTSVDWAALAASIVAGVVAFAKNDTPPPPEPPRPPPDESTIATWLRTTWPPIARLCGDVDAPTWCRP